MTIAKLLNFTGLLPSDDKCACLVGRAFKLDNLCFTVKLVSRGTIYSGKNEKDGVEVSAPLALKLSDYLDAKEIKLF